MSDIFSISNSFSKNSNQNNDVFASKNEYWSKKSEERQKKNDEYNDYLDRYSVNISQEEYNVIKDTIADAEVPEDESYRWACALELNKQYDIPVSYAYENLENINQALWGDRYSFTPKTNFKAIVDSGKLGANTLKMGRLGNKIMRAEMFGKDEYNNILAGKVETLEDMLAEYEAIEQENATLQDYEKRNPVVEAIKFGAQSAPFTGYVMGMGLLGSVLAPGVGTAAAFKASMDNAAGLEYIKLRQAGSEVDDAAGFALISGGLQALVETSLGNVAGALGKTTIGDLASRAVKEKITANVFKRLAYDGTFKTLALRMGKEWLKENVEEGIEEVVQDLIEKGTDALAAELGGYEIEPITAKKIARDAWENFKGGVMGSLVLGLGPSVIKSKADAKEFVKVKNLAEAVDSPETFAEITKNSAVFEGMSAEERKSAQKATWERAQQRKEEAVKAEAKNLAETLDAGKGAEQKTKTVVNENGEEEEIEAEPEPIHRENGKLDIQDDEHVNNDGTTTGTYVVGDSTKEGNNRYGYITYTADEDNKTVTIDTFKMTEGREGLRGEFYDEFAQKYAGYDIKWNPIQNESQRIKEALIADNPSGKKAGLNYYSENDIVDFGSRKEAAKIIGETFHNIEERNGELIQTPLNKEQIATGVAFLELGAKLSEETLTDFMNKNFNNRQFIGPRSELIESAIKNNISPEKVYGGFEWKNFGKDLKAVIYAGQNADFDTFIHECTHMFQSLLTGDLKKEAERLFNVQEGDWRNSTYVLPDGRKMSSAEAFVEMYQDWVIRKKAPSQKHENIFKKLAQFIVDAYTRMKEHFTLTPEIENLFDKLLAEDDGAYAKALKAVEENDREYKATLKRKAEEENNARKAKAEEEKKTQEAEREAKSETTDFTEEEKKLTPEKAEKQLDEVTNENTEKENNAIDDALENTNLTDEQKKEVTEVLTNEASTEIDKAEATTEAASSAYIPDDLFFQKIVSDDELKEIISEIKHTETRQQYIDEHYTNKKSDYEINKYTSEDGKITANLEVYKYRNPEQKEIDEALFFANKGIDVTILDEPGNVYKQKYPDVLFNHSVLVEFKQVVSDKVNTIAGEIRDAANKGNSEVISVFFEDKSKNVNYEDVIKKVEFKQKVGDFTGEYDELLFVKDGEVTRLNKNAASPAKADTHRTSNNTAIKSSLSNILFQNKLDEEYKKAVESGDTEKAMQMLHEEADRKGYNLSSDYQGTSAFNGAAPYRNGYFDTKEARLQAIKDEEFEDTETLGDFAYDNADSLGFDYLINDPRAYRAADDKRREAITNLRNAINEAKSGKKNVTIKMYRSVPIDVKENSFRNGDWITPSKSYAEDNADVHNWGPGEYRIIEQDVDLEHVWWDGNDIAEWGYDDEKEAVYKNTENNRNLFEITYDKDGNLIPLSKRFDESNPSILFQTVYHGSPYIIHRPGGDVIRDEELGFDHSKMGTGEGVQAFGWGTYVTQVEGIANNYAKKLSKMPYTENEAKRLAKIDEIYSAPSHLLISIESKKDFLKARRASLRSLDNGGYETRINKNIKNFTKELKTAKREKDEENIKFYEDLIDTSIKDLEPERKESLRKTFQEDIDKTLVEIEELKKQHKVASKLLEKELPNLQKELEEIRTNAKNRPAENVYTLDIPDEDKGNYITWDEPISIKQYRAIYEQAKKEKLENFVGYLIEDVVMNDNTFTPPTGEWLYKQDLKYDNLTNKEKSLFLNRAGITGISYPAQFLSGGREDNAKNFVIFNEKDIKVTDWHARNIEGDVLFQRAYHGSGANFDKFDTENFGLSGEGSMSFGYGTYLTDSEEIARDYAERQADNHAQLIRNAIIDVKSKLSGELSERAKYTYKKELEDLEEKLRIAESSKPAVKIALEVLKANNFDAEKAKKDFENDTDPIYRLVYEYLNKYSYKELEAMTARNLYKVEIPDDGYLDWNKEYKAEDMAKIREAMQAVQPAEVQPKVNINNYRFRGAHKNTLSGEIIYKTISDYLGGDKKASQFLHSIGYAGIKYPAGTIHGNGNGAYNYVIFNDDDAKIVGHLFFQTQSELLDDALSFDNWQDFMDFYETMGKPEVTPIPYDADAQWYQSFWEMAHGMQTEQEKNENAMYDKAERDGSVPMALDALFETSIKSNPEILDNFLKAAAYIDGIDLETEWSQVEDAESAKERERIEQLKDAINITLSDRNWHSAIARIQGGNEITEGQRKRLMGEITDSFKIRDFRALYSEIMDDEQFAVDEEDTVAAQLSKKLSKYNKKYDILKPNEDIARMSPEKHKRIAEELQNREIANKIANGSLKLDDELDAYYKSLNKQVKEKQKQFDELEAMQKSDYQRIADWETRQLLKLHDELILARGRMTRRSAETDRMIKKGLKITEKYRLESQNLNANYDEIFRKFSDLKNSIQITAEVQAMLDRQEQVANAKEDLNAKNKEKNLIAEVKKMRIQLVKRTMRRVPFNRIDYENAKTIIAVQRMLEPNLLGGVNRFIGIDSPFLRGVISGILTDSEYKEKLLRYLEKTSKASEAYVNFKKKLMDLKSMKDFDSWTAKERKYAIKHLPKENWVHELNLNQLAKEREESIDLDIGMKEIQEPVYDENTGERKTYKDADGNEHFATRTGFRLEYDKEIGKLVQDAVGADMFDRIINKPFSEWTTEELEQLAQRIDELYTEGRDLLAAKNKARKQEAERIRTKIEDAILETNITINDDDTEEERERKQQQIIKILGLNDNSLKGTEGEKSRGIKAKLDRLIHSYNDLNVLRFARIMDGQSEGENVRLLYRMEDECYNRKMRAIHQRTEAVLKVMKENNITEGDLAQSIKVPSIKTEFTVDELFFILAADKDYAEDERKLAAGFNGLDANDDIAPTSRNAVMFGNMLSDTASQEEKEMYNRLDKEVADAIENDTLTPEQKEALAIGQLDKHPGTTKYIASCHAKWEACIATAKRFLESHPEYNALMEAIAADFDINFEHMNEVSINEFNTPVHRVKCYVPLVRRESNGDTNVIQVKEDLLGAYGAESGKQWVNRGMTQRRQTISPLHQKPVQMGLFRTWMDSVERTEHFIAYSPYVRQLNAVYKSREAAYTRRFIEARYGKAAVEYIDNYINEVANPNANKIREKGAELLHTLRGKTAPAYLGWKFSAIVKQGLTSPWPYMQFVNPAEYLAACFKCINGGYDAIKEKSVFMKSRVMDPVNELVDEMADQAKNKFDKAWSKFAKTGMAGLEWIDWACVAPGWLACYEKEYNRLQKISEAKYEAKIEELKTANMYADISTREYLTPEQIEAKAREELLQDIEIAAVQYADDCTRQCQPSSRTTDLAPLFKNSSEAMKAFLQFQTSLNVIWQNIRYDLPYAIKQKQFNRIAGTICGYVFAGIFMNSVMDGVSGDDDDDKEMQALRNLIYYSTTQFTDAIPIMGSEITNTMDQLITGKRGFYGSGTDMTPSATKLLSALQKAQSGNWEKAAALTAEGIGLFMGAPVSGIKEINKLLGKPLDEGDVNLLRGISDVYGLAGDIIGE